jgi:pimeloyl-ACP methyl ester carboxylesterase
MQYDVRGSGEALLLIPGFASGAWSWSWQTPELSKTFEVITFDPIGISRSTIRDGEVVSIPAIAKDIAGLIDSLGLGRVNVLGISFGGFVAQEFALRFPGRVQRLILASTSFGGSNHVAPSTPVLSAFASTEGLNSADRIRKYMTVAFRPEFVRMNEEAVDEFCRLREQNNVPREIYMQQLQAALNFDVENELSTITADTLVITGDDDIVVPPENSSNLAACIPGANLETISGSGHMVFVEKADEFNRIVSQFLKRSSSGEIR